LEIRKRIYEKISLIVAVKEVRSVDDATSSGVASGSGTKGPLGVVRRVVREDGVVGVLVGEVNEGRIREMRDGTAGVDGGKVTGGMTVTGGTTGGFWTTGGTMGGGTVGVVVATGGNTPAIDWLQYPTVPPLVPEQDQSFALAVSVISENVPTEHWLRVVEQIPLTGAETLTLPGQLRGRDCVETPSCC
jgi:hypothetical protein